ncbi:MAG: TetR/AcrR family transcriptional regulator [Leifsonia sp.]
MAEMQRKRGRPPGTTGVALLAVARGVFLERGYAGTSMDEVASRAKISKVTLYREHSSKARLYAAVVSDWAASGRDAMRPAVTRMVDSPETKEALLDLAQTMRDAILSPEVLRMRRLVTSEAENHPEVARNYLADSWDRNIDTLADGLAALADRGRLAVADPRLAADQFTWLIIGAPLNAQLLTGESPRPGKPVTLSAAVDLFLAGYQVGPSPTK